MTTQRAASEADRGGLAHSLGASICLALAIGLGAALLWGLTVGISSQLIGAGMVGFATSEYVQVAENGTPLIGRLREGNGSDYFSLDRVPVRGPSAWLSPVTVAGGTESHSSHSTAPSIAGFSDGQPHHVAWYFVGFADPVGPGYFVGYDSGSRRRMGYIGRSGFQETEPSASEAFQIRQTLGTAESVHLAQ